MTTGIKWDDDMSCVCSTHGKDEEAYKILARKPEGKRPLVGPMNRCDNITDDQITGSGV
jgi:hypothetical protein